jgi:DNA end-binding protein Ku
VAADKHTEETVAVRPFWSGTLTFGLVSVPVELYTATRSNRVALRMLGPDGKPLRRRYVAPEGDDEALEGEEIVRGFEVDKDKFVVVTDEELEQLEPDKTREIDLRRFVDRAEIDPLFCDRPYFLLPEGEVTKPYRLLAKIMEDTGRAGIASFVMRGREYLVAIFAENGILTAETLRRPDEVRTPESVGLPDAADPEPRHVKAFEAAIERLKKSDLATTELEDEDAKALRALGKKKPAKERVHVPEAERPEGEDVIDIVAVLKERLEAAAQKRDKPKPKQKATGAASRRASASRKRRTKTTGRTARARRATR